MARTKRDKLQPNQRAALRLLLQGWRVPQVAAALEVTKAAVYGWRRNNEFFKEEMDKALSSFEDEGIGGILELVPRAVEELGGLLEDPRSDIRLAASKAIMGYWQDIAVNRKNSQMLDQLERRLYGLNASSNESDSWSDGELVRVRTEAVEVEAIQVTGAHASAHAGEIEPDALDELLSRIQSGQGV
jgi:hypothetical protein